MSIAQTLAGLSVLTLGLAGCGGPNLADSQSALANPPPAILALNRTGSPLEGGMKVALKVNDLQPGFSVTYGGIPASSASIDASTGLLVTVTPANPEGFWDVVITNGDGQSATFSGFHYGPPPSITGLSPASGVRKGDRIAIAGAAFGVDGQGVQVNVGGAIAQIVSRSLDQIVIAAPKLNAGSYQVSVFNADSQYAVATTLLSYRP
ncbi:MAG: IPT/TIG domain-containing protein [Myxococcales bacterium]